MDTSTHSTSASPSDTTTSGKKATIQERKAESIIIAKDLFWRNGYDGASIEDVTQATGLNRYALYQLFGGKRGLFLAALDSYFQEGRSVTLALLGTPNLKAFDAIKMSMIHNMTDPNQHGCGCMMTTTAVEVAPKDPEIANRMSQYMGEVKAVMQVAICRAKVEGDIAESADPAGIAEIIFSLFVSSGVLDRMGIPQEQVVAHVDNAIEALRTKNNA